MNTLRLLTVFFIVTGALNTYSQKKAVFIILDGITADVLEKVETPVLDAIAREGGYTRAYVGGKKDSYTQSPTVSAVGYNHLLTGTWSNKHNVWDNDIKEPNYNYWNIFRIAKTAKPDITTAIFSTWTDNRTKLAGDQLPQAGGIKIDYSFDGFELDEKRFPHKPDRKFISDIDELVSTEAGRYIEEKGPDLSWVYLEFTDDMGHMYGDSPEYIEAIQTADAQVGKIWKAIRARETKYDEPWMIVVTTDHGRDAATGKSHGEQSDRERTIWIATNISTLNKRFIETPAMVDIMPSILRFMEIPIPSSTLEELDGVPFTGNVSISNLHATRKQDRIELTWDVLDGEGDVEILLSTTNLFKEGKEDEYVSVGNTKTSKRLFQLDKKYNADFYKILVKAPHNWVNVWVLKD